jgi:ubiquinone biosynthesis protein UbiJ
MLPSLFLQQIETALNRYLALDPESPARLQGLEGKVITIQLEMLRLSFQLSIHENRIRVTAGDDLPADIKIRGTPLSLLTLALSRDKKNHFFTDAVAIEGNAELGQQIIDLFDQLEIDWEEHLSQLVGDLPAHQFGRLARKFFAWGKDARESLTQNLNEYVHEEKPWFPPEAALEDFFNEVDELRLDIDRLEARVKRLQAEELMTS